MLPTLITDLSSIVKVASALSLIAFGRSSAVVLCTDSLYPCHSQPSSSGGSQQHDHPMGSTRLAGLEQRSASLHWRHPAESTAQPQICRPRKVSAGVQPTPLLTGQPTERHRPLAMLVISLRP